jgi:hypothetical protein
LRVIEATYGDGTDVVDVTERLQRLVNNGYLFLWVSNDLFGDPCVNRVKTLRLVYEVPESDATYYHEVEEHNPLLLPDTGTSKIGILYTNNSIPSKYLNRVLGQLKKASGDVDIITCPWRPIEGNPFPELAWFYHVPSYLTLTLQILKLLVTAQELGRYEYVFFLEHDVLYPEDHFDIEPSSEDVLWNTNYIGLCAEGFQTLPPDLHSLFLVTMRLPAAIDHFTSSIRRLLTGSFISIEPHGPWASRESPEPVVHINHGNHLSGYFDRFSNAGSAKSHPYWGSAASWWD